MWSENDKKQLWIFGVISLGGPLLLFLTYLGFGSDPNVTLFSHVVVLLPAFAAVVCSWAVKGAEPIPKRFYAFFTMIVVITAGLYFAELFTSTPMESIYLPFIECALAVIALLILAFEPHNAKVKYGLSFTAGKDSTNGGVIVLFILLYFVRLIPGYADLEYTEAFAAQLDQKALYLLTLPFLFFVSYLPFWGEEYGWRYCLQPLLQKKFGYWIGTLINGFVWGLWHIPMMIFSHANYNIFYAELRQIAFCICLAFFLAFAKEVTDNIWLVTFLHYLNNQFVVFTSIDPSYIGKVTATSISDVVAIFTLNSVFILPSLIHRLYLCQKAKKSAS